MRLLRSQPSRRDPGPSPSGDGGSGDQDRRRRGRFATLRGALGSALVVVGLGPLACAHQPGDAPPRAWTYTIHDQDEGTAWSVELCFAGPRPRALVGQASAAAAIVDARDPASGVDLPIDREAGRVDLRGLSGPCMIYRVDLAAPSFGWSPDVLRSGGDRLISTHLWLWHPPVFGRDPALTVRFDLGPDFVVSTPWPRVADAATPTFTPASTVCQWTSYVAVGAGESLPLARFTVAGGEVEVVTVGPARISAAGIERWITAAGEATADLYGRLPVDHLQVVVVPTRASDTPVLFGSAERGGGASIFLLISADAEDEAFVGEWVAIHEILHLGMPPVVRSDAWLPEGFVTYYTEVTRARTGLRSPAKALGALDAGFARGRADVRGGSLAAASRAMGRMHAYSWVYWGGAAIAMILDVTLRSTEGGHSLDAALRHLHRCCARASRRWTADEVLAELDTWAGSARISDVAARVLATPGFDELAPIYGKLGLSMVHATLTLDDDAPLAPVRRAIFANHGASTAAPR